MKLSKVIYGSAATAMLSLAIAAPAFASDSVTTMATTDALNLRTGESTNYPVITTMPKGSSVDVYGMSADGWYHVKYQDKEGYCYYRWLNFEGTAEGTVHDGKTTEMFPTAALNLREKPTTSSKVLKVVPKDMPVTVSAKHNGWFSVEFEGVKGYCYGEYLGFVKGGYTPEGRENDTAGNSTMNKLTTTHPLNVRAQPSKRAKVIGSFAKGEVVNVISMDQNGWCRVKFGSTEGYCYSKYLK